ncbi:hypothetical protein C8F04DRAFT_1073271 [Mycena alexandri]|uniref:SWI5-dependent HO expression protein 3 n=1 Tax=Mycena alexandri TaxID=1745969 RepID=A0AAD6TEC9_9AGAR|nr:hypothetical protein C8F04DRAFT_1073271 [Mycena alexandri]
MSSNSTGNLSYPTSPPPSERGLTSPRSASRPSSRTSIRSSGGRAPSPSVNPDDPVAVRNQVSTLKHTIRHQQAQLQSLENMLLRGPRPYPPEIGEPPGSAPMISSSPPSAASNALKMSRRSSYDVLHGIAPESSLPLPSRRDGPALEDFREGIPMSFNGVGPASPPGYKRPGSPTGTRSRIPVSSVGNARALADEGQPATHRVGTSSKTLSIDTDAVSPSSLAPPPPPSPNRRLSMTPGGTTKVLADLQTGVVNARNALENTKAQLRLSQRSVAQLTRQTEDLKEGRERLRLENEGLNNVVARKERLLQEVLDRARKAEAEAATLKTQLKSETGTSKKALREMETALAESTALSQKSEREYITLRDSIKALVEGFKSDTARLREEMTKREEKWRGEAESVGKKYRLLLEEIKGAGEGRAEIQAAREADAVAAQELEKGWQEEIARLKGEVERSSKESEETGNTARQLAAELARLRRLMQNVRRLPSDEELEQVNAAPP